MGVVIGTELEMLAAAVLNCVMTGAEATIRDSKGALVWQIECDFKVDDDDLTFPAIVHLRGSMSSDAIAILVEREE